MKRVCLKMCVSIFVIAAVSGCGKVETKDAKKKPTETSEIHNEYFPYTENCQIKVSGRFYFSDLLEKETTSDQIEYEVVEEEKSGILGLFSKPAVIRVRKKENVVDTVKNFLAKTFQAMKLDVEIETEFDEVENEIRIELKGTEMGMLIGKRGQTLDSLQYLTSLVANKNKDTYTKIKIDTENYRQRRKETIENLARNVASKVKKTGRPAFLEPMNPYERRIIHAELQADKYVDTHSEGEEPHRKVVVTLNREFASELPRRNNYRRRNNNYSRDRKRPYQEKKD